MLKAGITGGIGSGKSMVCQVFAALGIPVFNADNAARYLMEHNLQLVAAISDLLGHDVYSPAGLDRDKVSAIIYHEPGKLQQLNALVHPATIAYAAEWLSRQSTPYTIKEAALFFESGSNTGMDVIIGVQAPKELRIARTMARSHLSQEQALAIMDRQLDEDEKMKRCDHIIINDDTTAIIPQVLALHEVLLNRATTGN